MKTSADTKLAIHSHMMHHMRMGKESMSQRPMMKDMKAMEDKSRDAHKEHQAEKK